MKRTPDLKVADVMERHALSRASAYRHMARAVGRAPGVRGALRCPAALW